ncbi:hypothetical protein [Oscillatoria sp. FACHB-1406]|uniref:hypothetical protein n=1 Tax=Oscillatoria sp. FACHB-1406 TaxID=2692846 RepID=UPI00168878F1|nr:hypothetical protein [Oscillatoria sp. FACHB-1406]MBD2577362.1 hypothetical protein [Oscillatoria sp. FACHB-1406]
MGIHTDCGNKYCEDTKQLVDVFAELFNLSKVEETTSPPIGENVPLRVPGEETESGENLFKSSGKRRSGAFLSEKEIDEKFKVIGDILMKLMTQDLDGDIKLERVLYIKIQVQKVLLDLERLSIRLQESQSNESEVEVIKTDITREIVRFLSMVLRC